MQSSRASVRRSLVVVAVTSLAVTGCHRRRAPERQAPERSGQATLNAAPLATTTAPPIQPRLEVAPDVAAMVQRVTPAVVNVTAMQESVVNQGVRVGPFTFGPLGGAPDRVLRRKALGSGFIVDPHGRIVTNEHVVDGATTVRITLNDERELDADVIGRDPALDVAVLQIQDPPPDLPVASLGSSEALRVGAYVVAIGNPFGLGNTATFGIVSAKGRAIGAGPYDDFIQTDASINPGNSGGPLFDMSGQVVGINTAINPEGQGIGFAIPIDAVKAELPQLVATGHVARGRLGVAIRDLTPAAARALGLDRREGALVADVERGGPAAKAGIQKGDLVVAVDGTQVRHAHDLPRLVARHAPGDRVKLTVLRDGQTRTLTATLAPLEVKPNRSFQAP